MQIKSPFKNILLLLKHSFYFNYRATLQYRLLSSTCRFRRIFSKQCGVELSVLHDNEHQPAWPAHAGLPNRAVLEYCFIMSYSCEFFKLRKKNKGSSHIKHWRIQHKYFLLKARTLELFNILLLWTVILILFHVTVLPLFRKSNVICFVRLSFPLFFF